VISNRLPPRLQSETSSRKKGVSGLVAGIAPLMAGRGGIWLGWSGQTRPLSPGGHPFLQLDMGAPPKRAAIDLQKEWHDRYYNGFCNRTLWPLFHGFLDKVRYADDEWRAYTEANRAFADAACRLTDPDASVWVHDYHLMLVGAEMRRLGHRGPIGFFHHVPFPSLEILETLPWHRELLCSMRSYDLVGFHTQRYLENYIQVQSKLVGAPLPDNLRTGVFPIGTVPEAFAPGVGAEPADELTNFIGMLGGRKLILGVDRLDYSKGIPERLQAYDLLLRAFPEWRSKISLVQVSVPSREDIAEYAALRSAVETLVGRINGEFGEADWVPVRYLYRSYDRDQLARLYRAADVGFVTPLRDGMNLVAKEFVAAQRPEDPGALLLSRFAGAADELHQAVLTNPFHPEGVAADLDKALRMPLAERVARYASMMAAVRASTATVWADDFLRALERTEEDTRQDAKPEDEGHATHALLA
jgi:trehalose 6-phosphate synthase